MSATRTQRSVSPVIAVVLLAGVAVVLLGTTGCTLLGGGVTPVELPATPAGITGTITSLDPSTQAGVICTMLVEGGEQPDGAVSDKASVTVTEDALVAQGARWMPAQDLAVGMTVRVWFDGAVAESYPVQGTARFIEVQQVR